MMKIVIWGTLGIWLVVAPVLASQNQDNLDDPLTEKLIIGRAETAYLSDWGITLTARIDTGASRSTLHVDHIEQLEGEPERIRFETQDQHGQRYTIEADVVKHIAIKSSFGQVQHRPLIQARLCLAGREFETVVTLADRSAMRFPMLIGRWALKGRFLIDPDQRHAGPQSCSPSEEAVVSSPEFSSN